MPSNINKKGVRNKDSFDKSYEYESLIVSVIIACEDKSSSPTYFKEIIERLKKKHSIATDSFVIVPQTNTHPTGVLEDLISYEKDDKTYKDFEHRWIVIDRDKEIQGKGKGHTAKDFNEALKKAKDE